MATRQRSTELEREIARRSTAVSLSLGRDVRDGRIRLSMTHHVAAEKVGISQTAWSRIQAECWNTFGDLGAAIRATNRKTAEAGAHAIATAAGDGDLYRIATVWVVRGSAGNRALLARYPHIFEAAFPGSSRRWVAALATGTEPPIEPGLVWFDPGTHRLTEHRRATMPV